MQANLDFTYKHYSECELQQMTPMVHFQPNQPGATLRATQVKPMLDRFLRSEYKREHNGEDVPPEWLMLKDAQKSPQNKAELKKTALRYKLSIAANGEPLRSNERKRLLEGMLHNSKLSTHDESLIREALVQLPPSPNALPVPGTFFANMPPKANTQKKVEWILTNTKELLLFPKPLNLQIYCKNSELLSFINRKLKDFFLLHSFGIRTSKGFGSFVVKGTDDTYAQELYRSRYGAFIYAAVPHIDPYSSCEAINYAAGIVQLMKSGINHPPRGFDRSDECNKDKFYIKGHLFNYYLNQGIGNEKYFIKNRILLSNKSTLPQNHRFVRALLGFADRIQFRHEFHDTVSFISKDGSLERFKSPVTIRIGNSRVYFLPENYPSNYQGHSFLVLNKYMTEKFNRLDKAGKSAFIKSHPNDILDVPDNFNLKNFLFDFAEKYNQVILDKIKEFSTPSFKNITHFSVQPLKMQTEGGSADV